MNYDTDKPYCLTHGMEMPEGYCDLCNQDLTELLQEYHDPFEEVLGG